MGDQSSPLAVRKEGQAKRLTFNDVFAEVGILFKDLLGV